MKIMMYFVEETHLYILKEQNIIYKFYSSLTNDVHNII